MIRSFGEVRAAARELGRIRVAVAAAQDHEVVLAVKEASEQGLVDPILVGDERLIRAAAADVGLRASTPLIHEPDVEKAAAAAVQLVRRGEAQVLMKGMINTSAFLRAALDAERGLRAGAILSHLMVFEIPDQPKLAFHTDGGINIAPGLQEKSQILANAVTALNALGIERPNVAVLTANEQVSPKMPATVDAQALVELWKAGRFPPCFVEGPIAMDVAASRAAAAQKGLDSRIAGNVDLFVVPNIEAGNFVGKTLVWYARAKVGGVVLGAARPIVMVSRSDDAEGKVNSLALACLIARRMKSAALGAPERPIEPGGPAREGGSANAAR